MKFNNKYDKSMIFTAKIVSNHSYCKRKKVGALLVKDNRIIATGYNGTIAGIDNDCELMCDKCNGTGKINQQKCENCNGLGRITNEFVLHAEQNVIAYAAKNGISTNDTTMYITLAPCKICAKLMIQAGVTRIVYSEKYRDMSGVDFLNKLGIKVDYLEIDMNEITKDLQ